MVGTGRTRTFHAIVFIVERQRLFAMLPSQGSACSVLLRAHKVLGGKTRTCNCVDVDYGSKYSIELLLTRLWLILCTDQLDAGGCWEYPFHIPPPCSCQLHHPQIVKELFLPLLHYRGRVKRCI